MCLVSHELGPALCHHFPCFFSFAFDSISICISLWALFCVLGLAALGVVSGTGSGMFAFLLSFARTMSIMRVSSELELQTAIQTHMGPWVRVRSA